MKSKCLRRLVLWATLGVVVGCGDSTPKVPVNDTSGGRVDSDADVAPVIVSSTKPVVRRSDEVWLDDKGRKYIGRVPYDVFFDNPLELAGEGTVIDSPSTPDAAPKVPVPAEMPAAEPATAEQQMQDDNDWGTQLPIEVLESEVKACP